MFWMYVHSWYKTGQIAHAHVVAATCDAVYALMCNGSVRNLLKDVTVSSTYTYNPYGYHGKGNLCLYTTEGGAMVNGAPAAGEQSNVPPPDTHKPCV